MTQEVVIEKLVHGGQGIGTMSDGRKVFVWNALPGEKVRMSISKKKRGYAEGIAEEILESSSERIDPKDEAYLSTSPWQIMTWEAENKYKLEILKEAFAREHVNTSKDISFYAGEEQWRYRNKMEYSFWGDEAGLHLALFHRASHGKRIISGSSIARPEIDEAANAILAVLNAQDIRGTQLKTVVLRCNQAGKVVAAIFAKDPNFPKLTELENICEGVAVYYSNPKSPASIITKELYTFGTLILSDDVLGTAISYDVNSFFQVNLPVFDEAAQRIAEFVKSSKQVVDMYSGVGTLGIPVGATTLVEIDQHNTEMARHNAAGKNIEVVEASAEGALEYIGGGALIVDPPRAGLHTKVTDQILEVLPEKIAYLSCNPSTQARDLAALQSKYEIVSVTGYNFFPRTPHIESLALLKRQ